MIKCIVVDDELAGIEVLTDYIQKTNSLTLVKSFRDSTSVMTYLRDSEVDVAFLDINMPDISGIDLVRILDEHYGLHQGPMVVFSTAYRDYAVDGYDYNRVIGFLHKPYGYGRFLKTVVKIESMVQNNSSTKERPDHIFFEYKRKKFRVVLDDILYAMSERNYTSIATNDQSYRILKPITEVEKMLPSDRFIRIHKSYLIAIDKIEKIEYSSVRLIGIKASFKIGTTYRENMNNVIGRNP